MTSDKAIAGLIETAKTNSDDDVKEYIHEHWIEFPLKFQDALVIALMTDAVRDHVVQMRTSAVAA